jgi:hypothetical protein
LGHFAEHQGQWQIEYDGAVGIYHCDLR